MTHTNKIKTTVYNLLAHREYSSNMIGQKLARKGFEQADIETVLADLSREGIVSDIRFTENYIRYRQSRGYGPLRIRQELLEQGIAKETIEDHLDITDNAWFTEAHKVWQKRFRGKQPSNMKDRWKQARFLQYRGFTTEQIENIYNDR